MLALVGGQLDEPQKAWWAELDDCPIPMAHDRFEEAHYFLHEMLEHYHMPVRFRFSANAFLSALKGVMAMLQTELQPINLSKWLQQERTSIDVSDPLLRAFHKGRDIVLHQRALFNESEVEAGLFRDRRLKLTIGFVVPTDAPTEVLLHSAIEHFTGKYIDEEHSEIGMEVGVRRWWRDKRLSDELDVVSAAHAAWARTSELVSDAHKQCGYRWDPIPENPGAHDVNLHNLLTESDLDADAPERWGWLG